MAKIKLFSHKKIIIIFSLVFITVVVANIDIPHSKEYSTITTLDGKEFYIYFKKPEKNQYSKLNVVLLDENRKELKDLEVEANFKNIITFNKSNNDMAYKTDLTKRSETEYSAKFQLHNEGLWQLKLKVFYNDEVLNFKDSFYYVN